MSGGSEETTRLFFAGDVMTGRGVDQIREVSAGEGLREPHVDSARLYVDIAEKKHGPIPAPVGPEYSWGDGLEVFEQFDPAVRIVNLETSITTGDDYWEGKSIHYRMHPANVDTLQAAGIDICSVANNHVLDFGRSGLVETLEVLEGANVEFVGAGRDLEEAQRPVQRELPGGARLLVWAFAMPSSGVPRSWRATPSRPGLWLVDELSVRAARAITDRVQAHKRAGDIAVISVHWGSNWGWEIPPAQQALAERLVDGGVDIIHGHSSHHLRPIEVRDEALIMHGCGDLITDYEGIGGHQRWRGELGAMFFADVAPKGGAVQQLRLVPTTMRKMKLRRAGREDAEWLERTLNRISEPFETTFELNDDGIIALQGGRNDGDEAGIG